MSWIINIIGTFIPFWPRYTINPGSIIELQRERITAMQKWRGILGWLTLGLILVFFLAGGQTARAQEQTPGQQQAAGLTNAAEVISLLGKVEIKSPQEAAFRPAKLKDPLNPGDQVRTLEKSRAKLWFRDETVLIVNENTTMEITQFQAGAPGRSEKSRLKVLEGAIRFILSKVSTQGPRNFEIEGKTAVMGIRGTDGVFETHSPDIIYCIAGGPLNLLDKATGKTATLNAGQMATMGPGGAITIQNIPPGKLEELNAQYRVAQVFIPRGITKVDFADFGNPLLPQMSYYRSVDGSQYILQGTLPTIHQGTLPTIHNGRR